MKKRVSLLILVVLVMLLVSTGVSASTKTTYVAHLTGSAEIADPAVVTQGTGQAIFRIIDGGNAIEYRLIVANIDNVTQSHIHIGPETANGPVVTFLYGLNPQPSGTSNGVLATGVITQADLIARPAIGFGGTMAELIAHIEHGMAYVNVHTTQYPAGEIRGQIR